MTLGSTKFFQKRTTEPFLLFLFLVSGEKGKSFRERRGRIFTHQLAAYRRLCGIWRRRLSPRSRRAQGVRSTGTRGTLLSILHMEVHNMLNDCPNSK